MPDEKDDVAIGLQKRLEKAGNDAMALAADLYSENYREREANRKLKDEKAELEKKIPAEGSVVLSKADALRWEEYQKLGKVDEVKAAITERDALKTENAGVKREQTLRDVADAMKWNLPVVKRLADGLEFEITDGKNEKGEAVKTVQVITITGDKREAKPASEFAEKEWSEFLPSLNKEAEVQKDNGTRFVKQAHNKPAPATTREQAVEAQKQRLVNSNKYQV